MSVASPRVVVTTVLRRAHIHTDAFQHHRLLSSFSCSSSSSSLLRSSSRAPSSSSSHRCSPSCPVHRRVHRGFASHTSPNPFPTSADNHVVSSGLPPSFRPADPEVEGYKTRLSVERRVWKAITANPKFSAHPVLLPVCPPLTDDGVDTYRIGHDDGFASVTFAQLEADSLDKIELLVAVEKEFGTEFSDDQFDRFSSIGDLIETVLWNPAAS